MKTLVREIFGKEFEIRIADSTIADGVDFQYQTQDEKIFGASYLWGYALEDLTMPDLSAIIGIIERDLMNRRDVTLEQKYVIVKD